MIVGAQFGVKGLALGYVPVTLIEIPAALVLVFYVLNVTPVQVWRAVRTPLLSAAAMATVTVLVESLVVYLTGGADAVALVLAFVTGLTAYAGSLRVLDRQILGEARTVLMAGL
jgi:hypothetical protein